jgi:chromosome segregation ATPase
MPTASPIDLESEIQRLRDDLRDAECARITPADRKINEIRDQLAAKESELQRMQESEAAGEVARQHAEKLQTFAEIESAIERSKTETLTHRRMLAELPGKLSVAEYQLNQLLRTHAQLKKELGL